MATSEENDTYHILLCSICLEKLNRPKYLPCLHTFCETCIQTYIASGFDKGNTKSFDCPVCRFVVTAATDNISPEEWANQLPLNFLIGGLLEKEKVQRPEKQCMSCERMNVQTEATVLCMECSDTLCENCMKCHRANKSSSRHEIKQLAEVTSDEQLPNAFRNNCNHHSSKKLKLFCMDHDEPCCSMCVSINHRKCNEIVSIEDAAKTYCSTSKFNTMQRELDDCSGDIASLISEHKKCLTHLESQYQTKVTEIENTCKEIVDKIKLLETQRKAEILKLFNAKKDELESKLVHLENHHKMITNDKKIIEISEKRATEVQVMLESRKVLKQLVDHKKLLAQDITEFNLTLENIEDIKTLTNQLLTTCKVGCEEKQVAVDLVSIFELGCEEKQVAIDKVSICEQVHKINRFNSIASIVWHMSTSGYVNAIAFRVSSKIRLLGFVSFQCVDRTPCKIKLTLREGHKILAEVTTTTQKMNDSMKTVDIKLEKSLQLQSGVKYDVVFHTNETKQFDFYKGENGQPKVTCDDVIFTFEKSNHNHSATSVYCGQIPGFLFQM